MNISKKIMNYNTLLGEKVIKKRNWTSRILNFIKKNKIVSISIVLFLLCVNVNLILIARFLSILQYIKQKYYIYLKIIKKVSIIEQKE